ncbi:MAG: DUF11 domain-containing protein [Oscillochloris sp.]|nr:DUF11 domain-containing protein [Oscillochloris sp.]
MTASNAATVLSNIAQITARAEANVYMVKTLRTGGALDVESSYRVQVCMPAGNSSGGLNLSNLVIVDTLPTNAVFVSATNGGTYNAGTNQVTWPATTLTVGSGVRCVNRDVTVRFLDADFDVGDSVINSAEATATLVGGGTITVNTTDERLIQPPSPNMSFGKNGPSQALLGDIVGYNFTLANTGTAPLSNVQFEDVLPAELRVQRIYAGAGSPAVPLQIEYTTNLNASYTVLTGSPFAGSACVNIAPNTGGGCSSITLAGGEYITALRYRYTADLPFGFTATAAPRSGFDAEVVGTPINSIIDNTAIANFTYNGYTAVRPGTVDTRIVPSAARPSVVKNVSPGVAYFGEIVTYTVTLANNALGSATPTLNNPVLADLLDTTLEYVPGSWTITDRPAGAPDPIFEQIANYNNSGRVLLRWRWDGASTYNLAANNQFVLSFQARILPTAPAGQISNTASLASAANTPAQLALDNCQSRPSDTQDLDGDGNTSEQICSSSVSNVALSSAAAMDALKLVIGQLDTAYSRFPNSGLTTPGGQADYQLVITNTSTIPMTELVLVDVLPWIGDTGVIDYNNRLTEWRPYLIGPIDAPAGAVVYYSTQSNPCRAPDLQVASDSPGCTPPVWSTVPPADITTVQAVKVNFGSLVLQPNDSVRLNWAMRAPVGGTPGEIAWNSFGFIARRTDNGDYLLPSEPLKVGIERGPLLPPAYGNYVWLDNNLDGVQDVAEPGISGARIELYTPGPDGTPYNGDDQLINYTLSGPDNSGNPGYYFFSDPAEMIPGDYYIVVTPPAGYGFTNPDQGADDTLDSDIDPATRRSAVTTLDPGEIDGTWDVGLNTVAGVGNYVWFDRNNDGIQNEAPSDGINGVTVRLYDGSNNLVDTAVTANDPDGQPGYYLFTGLTPASYFVEFVLPSGATFSGPNLGGDDALDSDPNPADGRTGSFTLSAGQLDLRYDAGIILPTGSLRLGNRVWNDRDNDGRYEPGDGEIGIDDVRLDLYRDLNGNNVADPNEYYGTTSSRTISAQPGFYSFENLPAGNFIVVVPASNFAAGGTLNGMRSSSGNDPAPDPDLSPGNVGGVDHDDNGRVSGADVATLPVTLSNNAEPDTAIDGDNRNGNLTVDFGFHMLGALGNYVWVDLNSDGLQDANETGVSGVTVELLDAANTVLATDSTDFYGAYGFTGLAGGDYRLRFSNLPAGYTITTRDVGGDDALDSDVNPATGETILITLPTGAVDLTWDMGLAVAAASIGDRIWIDDNRNGIQEAGETSNPGGVLSGLSVELYRADNTLYADTTTDASGNYSFNNLPPGDYYVIFAAPPAGYAVSPQNQGADEAADSDADLVTRRTATTTLSPGENDPTWDLGIYTYASIGDRVWNDVNNNGIQDGGETGVSGVTVRLFRPGEGVPYATTSTNASGNYSFTNLPPADYYLEFVLLSGYAPSPQDQGGNDAIDSDVDPGTLQTIVTTLTSGENDTDWDFGIYRTAAIGNFVWLDLDTDGIQDSGEPGVAGVQIVLFDSGGAALDTIVSDASGNYSFSGLAPGDYYLRFVLPPSYLTSPNNQGANDNVDSDPAGVNLDTAVTTLIAGETDNSWDFGIYQPAALGDRVWHDQDGDGVQDVGEPGIDGVTVTLRTPGPNGTIGDGDDTTEGITVTAAGGFYRFDNLPPGDYYVQFGATAGYTDVSPQNQGAVDSVDSDADPTTRRTGVITLVSSQIDMNWDMGVFNRAALGDRIWIDDNADGIQDPGETNNPGGILAGLTVELYRADGTPVGTTTTDAGGLYGFSNLTPGSYYVVFNNLPAGYALTQQDQGADNALDSDPDRISRQTTFITLRSGDNDITWDAGIFETATVGDRVWVDANADGIQDAGETVGVSSVRVDLLAGATIIDSTYTDADGLYLFTDLLPGTYTIQFSQIPSGWLRSPENQGGDDATDSDGDATFSTASFSIGVGADDRRYDQGLYQPASLGDRVWHDQNANGVQDTGEPGISGVTVSLLDGSGNPIDGDGGTPGVQAVTTITDGSGIYTFTNLTPGTYRVEFAFPAGYDRISPQDQGGDDTADSDADPVSRRTAATTLISGQNDPNWDMGVYRLAAIGNRVWEDQDGDGVQDGGEPNVDGVTVSLLDGSGNPIDGDLGTPGVQPLTTTTGGGGVYSFTGLIPRRLSRRLHLARRVRAHLP